MNAKTQMHKDGVEGYHPVSSARSSVVLLTFPSLTLDIVVGCVVNAGRNTHVWGDNLCACGNLRRPL